MSAPAETKLLTAAEFLLLPSNGPRAELVRGQVIMMNMPGFRHGRVCIRIARWLSNFVEDHDLGHVVGNDSGVVTHHDPDTVRGSDIAFYSYARVPRHQEPVGYPTAVPELVFEVLSPTDRLKDVLEKVAEYLAAGVSYVVVVDPDRESVVVHNADRSQSLLLKGQSLTLPELLPGFELPLERLFPGP